MYKTICSTNHTTGKNRKGKRWDAEITTCDPLETGEAMRAIATYGFRYQQAKASRFRFNASTDKEGLVKMELPELDEMDSVFSFEENFNGSKKDRAKWIDKYKRCDEAYLVRDEEEERKVEKRRRSKKREHHMNIKANLSVVTNTSNVSVTSANSTAVSDITRESESSIDQTMDDALNDTQQYIAQRRSKQQTTTNHQQMARKAYLKRQLESTIESDKLAVVTQPKATSSPKRSKFTTSCDEIPLFNRYELQMNSSHRSDTTEMNRFTRPILPSNISITGAMANRLGSKYALELQNLSANRFIGNHSVDAITLSAEQKTLQQVGDTTI